MAYYGELEVEYRMRDSEIPFTVTPPRKIGRDADNASGPFLRKRDSVKKRT